MNTIRRQKIKITVAAMSLVCLSSLPAMSANKLIVKDSTGTTDKYVVTDQGKVGINLNNPDAALHIKSGASYPSNAIMIEGNATSGSGGIIGYLVKAGTLPLSGERLGFIYFGSQNTTTNPITPLHATGMKAVAESAWTATSTPAFFSFETTPSGSTTRTERMRITSAGNVGIGTINPTQKLEVNGGIRIIGSATQPSGSACTSATRGTLYFVQGSTDLLLVCAQAGGTPIWRTVNLQ